MKKLLTFILVSSFYCQLQAQDEIEFTTYTAEKALFVIDLPDHWSTGISEVKSLMGYATAITSYNPNEKHEIMIVNSVLGCKSPANEVKGFKKVWAKGAKKANDPVFRIIDEGERPDQDGKNYYWVDYIKTFELDDGTKYVIRERFIARCHYARANKYANTFTFQATEEKWEETLPLFEEIYSTARYLKKKDL